MTWGDEGERELPRVVKGAASVTRNDELLYANCRATDGMGSSAIAGSTLRRGSIQSRGPSLRLRSLGTFDGRPPAWSLPLATAPAA